MDAFGTAKSSLLVKRLNASTERSQPESPLKPIAKFSVGDAALLSFCQARNGKERWFRACVERAGTHSYDVRFVSTGSVESVPKSPSAWYADESLH